MTSDVEREFAPCEALSQDGWDGRDWHSRERGLMHRLDALREQAADRRLAARYGMAS